MFNRIKYNLIAILFGFVMLTLLAGLLSGTVAGSTAVRFVDENGLPLANTAVWLLCYASETADSPLHERHLTTDGSGSATLPARCSHLAALRLLHIQPSGKPGHGPAYRVYATSWLPGSNAPVPTFGDVVISAERPLILFDVVVSLAWLPAPDSPILDELYNGLADTSAYLYNLTEGQMAFGPITLHTGGNSWETADFRLLPANDYRPTAYVGGMVTAPTPYTAPTTLSQTVYVPAAIYLGRQWDGVDARAGAWSEPAGYRTLAHEWGHYALFLYDEYQQRQSGGGKASTYCVCPDLPLGGCNASMMAYHYTAWELWHEAEHGEPAACQQTDQWLVHGEGDWQALAQWGSLQGVPNWLIPPVPPLVSQAPGLSADFFGRSPDPALYLSFIARPGTPPSPIFPPVNLTATLALSSSLPPDQLQRLYPQVYVLSGGPGSPDGLLYQGTADGMTPGLGQIPLVGVQPTDRARVFVDRYTTAVTTGGRFAYTPTTLNDPYLIEDQSLELITDTWQASLNVAYGMSAGQVKTMTLMLTSPEDLGAIAPTVWYCLPGSGCQEYEMVATGSLTWTAVLTTPTAFPHDGLLRIAHPMAGELIRWLQLAGGVGPGHMDGFAPVRDGTVMADAVTAVPGPDNRLILMPAASYEALLAPLPAGVEGILGTPLDLDILLPGGVSLPQPADHLLPVPVVLTLFYSQELIDRLGVPESQLTLLHYSRFTNTWVEIPLSGNSDILNWIAGQPIQEDGIYAVGWRMGNPLQANFQGFPPNGPAPLLVTFINLSTGDYTDSLWDFGDGITSTVHSPQHIYEMPGFYTVTLTVSNLSGMNTLTRPNYIFVQN